MKYLGIGIALTAMAATAAVAAPAKPAAKPAAAGAPIVFSKEIAPIFKSACNACHSGAKPAGGYATDSVMALMKGGKGGPAVIPGKSKDSRLQKYLVGTLKPQMPIGGALPKAQIDLIARWIDSGAKTDAAADMALGGGVEIPKIAPKGKVLPLAASLSFSKDGKWLAVGTYKEVRLYDVANLMAPPKVLAGHADVIHTLQFSPDSKFLAAGGGKPAQWAEIKIWDVTTGNLVRTLGGANGTDNHADYAYCLSWNHDGTQIATGSYDKSVKIWEANTGKVLKTLKDHADAVYAVAFRPDGQRLASGSADRSVKIWDVATGKRLYTLSGHGDVVYSVAFNMAGNQLASCGADKTLRVWNLADQNGNQAASVGAHGKTVNEVAYSPDGKMMATVSEDKSLKIWNSGAGNLRTVGDQTDALLSVAFSANNELVAVGGFDGTVRLYKTADGALVQALIDLPKDPAKPAAPMATEPKPTK